MSNASTAAPETMQWDSRARRAVMLWIPLGCFLLILLFPFYWMAITAFKPDAELYDFAAHNPFWITSPTLQHIRKLLFETSYPRWLWTTMGVAVGATFLSLLASTLASTLAGTSAFDALSPNGHGSANGNDQAHGTGNGSGNGNGNGHGEINSRTRRLFRLGRT